MKRFTSGVAVVTGAGSGLGKEFARTAASMGMKLVLADIQENSLDAVLTECQSQGVDAIGRRTDVSKEEDVQALADAATQTFGKITLLFNNAGVTAGGLVWENSQNDWDWVMGVNLRGIVHGIRAFTPLMLAEAATNSSYEGHIVNTASMAGLITAPAMGIYSVSKHAAVALTESVAHDLKLVTDQVHCSVLCPSYVPTNIGQADNNRPQDLVNDTPLSKSQLAARAISQDSITSGDMTAEQVAKITFEAIRNRDFYVCPQPEALALVRERLECVVSQGDPTLSCEGEPSLKSRRERLVAALRG